VKRSKKEIKAVVAEMTETRELLSEFGLQLTGMHPGVGARWPNAPGRIYAPSMDFDPAQWEWLEPLLRELRSYRASRVSQKEQKP
jgi:hypothetical protein